MTTVALYSYNEGSASAKALATALGIKRIKHENSKFNPTNKIVINWGSSVLPQDIEDNANYIINPSEGVGDASNKLTFFRGMEGLSCVVPHTTSNNLVREWLHQGSTVVARTKLTGHSGEGIVLLEGAEAEIIEALLYTLYVPKKHEYRVHISTKGIFDIQQKKRKTDVPNENVNWKIRNLEGGFIYARDELDVPECVKECALEVFSRLDLDFGAIDIIYNDKQKKAYALEVNTAPGLSGTTLDRYAEMIEELVGVSES